MPLRRCRWRGCSKRSARSRRSSSRSCRWDCLRWPPGSTRSPPSWRPQSSKCEATMALETAALTLLAFPQLWDADTGTLRLRFLCVPLRGPLTALGVGLPNFADANLSFEARLIGSLDHVPRAGDVVASLPLNLEAPPSRKSALFAELARQIDIDPAASPGPGAIAPRYRKAVTPSYRAVVGDRELSPYLAEGDEFDCALHEAHDSQPPKPVVLKSSLRWGQVLALALRQPRLA